jgi:hypothetical protein
MARTKWRDRIILPTEIPEGEDGDLIIVWVPQKKFPVWIKFGTEWQVLKLSEYDKLKLPNWEVQEHLASEKIVAEWLKNG